MCGINGIVNAKCDTSPLAILRMNEFLKHRGPDSTGIYAGNKFCLGHQRLAIVDISNSNSSQPMSCGDYVITYNGEIYNYLELRRELEEQDISFNTNSDTEVLLKGYCKWGTKILDKIEGQFAFAIINSKSLKTILARDRTGEKPLYFSIRDEVLYFSSLPEALTLEGIFLPSEQAIATALLHRVTFIHGEEEGGTSYYRDIDSVKAGEHVTIANNRIHRQTYYKVPVSVPTKSNSLEYYIGKTKELLTQSVLKRIPNEVKFGCSLSGGIDSSIITSTASRCYNGEIIAACIKYSLQDNNDDYTHAEILSRNFDNIKLIPTLITPENYLQDIEEMVSVTGPHDSISELAMFRNYKTLREEGIKVVLIGEGSDEFNWGYWFSYPGLYLDKELCCSAEKLKTHIKSGFDYVRFLMKDTALQHVNLKKIFDSLPGKYNSFNSSVPEIAMMGIYTTFQLEFLNKANDRLAMKCSLEARSPFQDSKVMKLACEIPMQYQIKNDLEKFVLREAFSDLLPAEILYRKKSPLPPATHPFYHLKLAELYRVWINKVDDFFWNYFNKDSLILMVEHYEKQINKQLIDYEKGNLIAGNLVKRRIMKEQLNFLTGEGLRANDIFQILTTMIWFTQQNFGRKKLNS